MRLLVLSALWGIAACSARQPEPAKATTIPATTASTTGAGWGEPDPVFVPARELALHSTGVDGPHGWVLTEAGYIGSFVRLEQSARLHVLVRAFVNGDETAKAKFSVVVAGSSQTFTLTRKVESYDSNADLPRGTYFVRLELAGAVTPTQEVTIEGLAVAGGTLVSRITDELALATADTYIENFRKRRGVAYVSDARAGSLAKVALVRHRFGFGTNVPGATNRMIPKSVTPGSEAEKFQSMLLGRFDTVVLSNGGKWVYQEERRDQVDLSYVDRFLEFATENRLRARMHTMLWDTAQDPAWVVSEERAKPGLLTRARGGDERAKRELREEISERIQDYVPLRRAPSRLVHGTRGARRKKRRSRVFGLRGHIRGHRGRKAPELRFPADATARR